MDPPPSIETLSSHAQRALQLCEHELGTDIAWAKEHVPMLGSDGIRFLEMLNSVEDNGPEGIGYVGEEDV